MAQQYPSLSCIFQELPIAADAYLLKQVLHNLKDDAALALLHTCRRAMPERAILLVCEQIITDEPTNPLVKGLDL